MKSMIPDPKTWRQKNCPTAAPAISGIHRAEKGVRALEQLLEGMARKGVFLLAEHGADCTCQRFSSQHRKKQLDQKTGCRKR